MRFILLSLLLLSFTPQMSQAAALTPKAAVISTKLDPELKNILEVIVNALVGRIPNVSKESLVTVDPESQLSAGSIRGQYSVKLNSVDLQPLLTTVGEIDILIKQTSTVEAMIGVKTTGRAASDELINFLSTLNQTVCVSDGTNCVAAPLLNPGEESLPPSQRGAVAFENFKTNLVTYLASFSAAKPAETKKRQTFGGAKAPAAQEGAVAAPVLPPEVAQRLSAAIENSFIVSNQEGAAVLTIDMEAIRAVEADFSQVNPALGLIYTFQSVEMRVTDTESTYQLQIEQIIPLSVVKVYDSYLLQEQQKPNGLTDLNVLVGKIGVWAVGRCSVKDHQSDCVNQLLRNCAKDLESVATCVTAAKAIQAARDTAKAAADGVNDVNQAGQDAAKNLGDLFNTLTGAGK